jgi:SHS2 domain-containing protein
MAFSELEHTADVLMRVTAHTPEELFAESARAMMAVMYGGGEDQGVRRSVSLQADTRDELLHDFLSELLFISEVERVVFSDVEVKFDGTFLYATTRGEPFDPDKHLGGTEIKGISYSGLVIRKDGQCYVVDILFDV